MGGGIAQVVAASGRRVSLHDAAPGATERGIETMRRSLEKLADKGGADPDEVLGRVEPADDLVPADLLIEAVIEDADVKQDVFRRADELLPDGAILASNTSSIPITSLASVTDRPDRVIGMHFFNPVPVLKLVEIVRGRETSEETASAIVALAEGIDLALANKESLVVGGDLVTALAEATDARIIPVDSEHSALYQLVAAEPPGHVERLVLTASGGPFRGRTDLSGVTPDEALAHPTWEMGGRITIDSATLINKGFELIEAHHLFGLPYERIEVAVHPQSVVHALVHLNDGASLAHLGYPDMRVPISYALHHPERADVDLPTLDLAAVGELTFERPDLDTFPCLRLAREAGEAGGTAPCVLNAADEVAVQAFLAGRIPFTAIAEVVERTLEALPAATPGHFEDLYTVDAEAREHAHGLIDQAGVAG